MMSLSTNKNLINQFNEDKAGNLINEGGFRLVGRITN